MDPTTHPECVCPSEMTPIIVACVSSALFIISEVLAVRGKKTHGVLQVLHRVATQVSLRVSPHTSPPGTPAPPAS